MAATGRRDRRKRSGDFGGEGFGVLKRQTYELIVRFLPARTSDAVVAKRRVLHWLAARGITNIAEAVCDGIADALPDATSFATFLDDGGDAAPLAVYDADRAKLVALRDALPHVVTHAQLEFRLTALDDEAWAGAWDIEAQTILTSRFFVKLDPDDALPAAPPGTVPLFIVSGGAFGDGRHATTHVALEVIEQLPSEILAGRCLDVGTGTGILGIAAAKLGSREICGTDLDPTILAAARANGQHNQVAMRLLVTEEIPADGCYDLVIANILAPVLHDLMPAFAEALAPDGALVLAGFIAKEADAIITLAARAGLQVQQRRERRGWVGLALSRRKF